MKYTRLLFLLVLLTLPLSASAHKRSNSTPAWTVTVDPLTTALGFVHVQIERAIGRHFSIYLGPSLRLFNGIISEDHEDFIGLGVEGCVRYYFLGTAPFKWWAGIRGVAAHLSSSVGGKETSAFGFYVSALAGYSWLVTSWLTLSAGLGIQYLSYQLPHPISGKMMGPGGILPAAHTNIGVAF